MKIPSALLEAIANPAGERVVVVVGAGCSFEEPTGLPLASEGARAAYRRLVDDGVLDQAVDVDKDDLSAVADAVVSATGGQTELVKRLPLAKFESATPNEGYRLAAAMLRERAIGCVLTLNFDLAMCHALSAVGASEDVGIIHGPANSIPLGASNLIFLHRNVRADHEDWILTKSALNNEWQGECEETIAKRVLVTPAVIFAGLGSPAEVLVECTTKVRNALAPAVKSFK